MITINVPEWHARAGCKGRGDLMFPAKEDRAGREEARATCARCPVRDECLRDALSRRDEYGIRGGMTGTERRLRRRAARA